MWVISMERIEYTAQLGKFSKKKVACLIHKRKTYYSPGYYYDNLQTSQLLITRIISLKKQKRNRNIFISALFCTFQEKVPKKRVSSMDIFFGFSGYLQYTSPNCRASNFQRQYTKCHFNTCMQNNIQRVYVSQHTSAVIRLDFYGFSQGPSCIQLSI